jgi:dTDP-4-dehydrorhamnose reductase
MNNILITGSKGQLGSEIRALSKVYPDYTFLFTDFEDLDITNHKKVEQFVIDNKVNTIVNCAAYTAVDKAEVEYELSDQLNHLAVENFARISKRLQIKLIHISTDYVFDGVQHRPYIESDPSHPQSVYGKTKLAGEAVMRRINPKNSIIIRTSWVYSSFGHNFVKTMLRLGKEKEALSVIFDQIGTPTYAGDLAKAILDIIPKLDHTEVELFHYSNEGVCSWYDFAKAIFEIAAINVKINAIESSEFPTAAKRPYYSVLNKSKIKNKFQIELVHWRDALKGALKKM